MARLSFYPLFLTLAVVYLSLAAVPSAQALQGMNLAPPMVKRAEHLDLSQRMIKKKRQEVPANPAPAPTSTSSPSASTQTSAVPETNPPASQSTPQTPSPNPSNSASNSATSTSNTSTSTSTSATSTSTVPTTPPVVQNTSSQPTSTPSSTRTGSPSTVRLTTTAAGASQTVEPAQDPNSSFLPKSVIIGLIVTGSCLAAGAAIWTIIRKWKFSPSRHFEDRLEPINWEPTKASELPHDPTVAALERASSRNGGGSQPGRGSLGSNDEHGNRNMTSVNGDAISMAPDFPPAHDFTAGAGAGAYGHGAPGYVDMHRGPSPAPPMGAYGAQHYETPNPYDAYDYGNQGYGQRRY